MRDQEEVEAEIAHGKNLFETIAQVDTQVKINCTFIRTYSLTQHSDVRFRVMFCQALAIIQDGLVQRVSARPSGVREMQATALLGQEPHQMDKRYDWILQSVS